MCRKSTFPSAKRFVDPQVIYGPRMANFSLIDINDYFKNRNGAPRLDKYSFRHICNMTWMCFANARLLGMEARLLKDW